MTLILTRNVLGVDVEPPVRLPPQRARRRLSTLAARHADRTRPFLLSRHRVPETQLAPCEDSIVLRRDWRHTFVSSDDVVIVTYLPQGGGGQGGGASQGKQIGMAVAALALAVIAPYAAGLAAGALGLGATAKAAIAAGITIGGTALLSLAARPKANKQEADTRPTFGVSGGGNLPRPGDRIPRLYGRCWTAPDLSQPDYFVYDGEDQVLFKRMTLGLGRYRVHTIRVGSDVMWTETGGVASLFAGSEVEILAPGATSVLVPQDVVSAAGVQGVVLPRPGAATPWAGPFVVSPADVIVDRIQLDISLPQGALLGFTNSRGSHEAATTIGWEFQRAPVDAAGNVVGPWEALDSFSTSVLSKRPLRYTRIIAVDNGRYAVRGRNTQTDAPVNARVTQTLNAVSWDGLRGWRPETRTRPNVTEIAMRVRSGERLGVTAFQDVQVEATAILPVWNGTAWVEQETRKAVWAYVDILRNSVYGAAILDSAIDVATAFYYAGTLAQHDTFDGVIRGPTSVWEAASLVLAPLRAEPVQLGRVWSLVRDEPKTLRRHVITRRQIVANTTTLTYALAPDDGAGHVIVEYDEAGDPRRPVQPPDFVYGSASLTPRRVRLFGVTSYSHAVELGRWLAASGFYRRRRVGFDTEHDGRIYKRGDSIAVDTWFATASTAAGVVARSGATLTIDVDVAVDAGDHVVLRDRSGREWGPVAVSQGASNREIVLATQTFAGIGLSTVLSVGTEEPTVALIGPVATLTRNYLVESARPSGRDRVAVTALADAPEVWAAIGAAPLTPPTPGGGPTVPSVPTLAYVRGAFVEGSSPAAAWQVSPASGAQVYGVELSFDDGRSWRPIHEGAATSGVASLDVFIDPDDAASAGSTIILIRARARGALGIWGPWVQSSFGYAAAPSVDGRRLLERSLEIDAMAQALREKITSVDALVAGFADALEMLMRVQQTGEETVAIARQEIGTRIGEQGEVIAQQTTELAALQGTTAAGFVEVNTAIAGLDSAVATAETELAALTGTVTAGFSQVNTSIAELDTAITSAETELSAARGGQSSLGARLGVIEQARVDGDAAVAGQVATVQALANAATAGGEVSLIASAAPAGYVAAYQVKVNASSTVAGLTVLVKGDGTSVIMLDASQFLLRDPNYVGGVPQILMAADDGAFVFQVPITIRNATTGQRLLITNSTIRVWDAAGVLRAAFGDLS